MATEQSLAWETEYRAGRPSGRIVADSAVSAVNRLVGAYVVDDSRPPKDADPDRRLREDAAVKIYKANCRRCGADLLGGVLPYLAAGSNQSCPMCGTNTYFPLPDDHGEPHRRAR